MNTGKTLFAQLMDFLPWTTFTRIVGRYDGDRAIRTLSCAEQFRVMAFAQLTYRESLRDIEACLSAQSAKLYHMGFREPVRRSTLADANASRDWRIYAEFAQRLIAQARRLYAGDSLGVDLGNAVYALDATTIDLCLSMFPLCPTSCRVFRIAQRGGVDIKQWLDMDKHSGIASSRGCCRRRARPLTWSRARSVSASPRWSVGEPERWRHRAR
jgi:hypothetical protein